MIVSSDLMPLPFQGSIAAVLEVRCRLLLIAECRATLRPRGCARGCPEEGVASPGLRRWIGFYLFGCLFFLHGHSYDAHCLWRTCNHFTFPFLHETLVDHCFLQCFYPLLMVAVFSAAMKTRIPECCDLPDPVSCPTFSECFPHDNFDFSLELYGDSLNRLHPKFYVSSRVKLSREAR